MRSSSCLALFVLLDLAALASAQSTSLESVAPGGFLVGAPGNHRSTAISDDGRWIAYVCAGDDVSGDSDHLFDVALRDRLSGSVRNVSVSTAGDNSNAHVFAPCISGDGRWVSFLTTSTNLTPQAGGGLLNVYLHDAWTSTTRLVSHSPSGAPANGNSTGARVSLDGSTLVFVSASDEFVPGTSGAAHAFVYDIDTDTFSVASLSDTHQLVSAGYVDTSSDGRFVAFTSSDPNVVSGVASGQQLAYLRDRVVGTTELVSRSSSGAAANAHAIIPRISATGRYVAFLSNATNLSPLDTSADADVFRFDRELGTTELVSRLDSGANVSASEPAGISSDGSKVLFIGDDEGPFFPGGLSHPKALLFDTTLATLFDVGRAPNGESMGSVRAATMTSQARFVAFEADFDVFARDLSAAAHPEAVTYCPQTSHSAGCVGEVAIAGFPSVVGPASLFVTARNMLEHKPGAFFWGLAPASKPFHGATLCVEQPLVRTTAQDAGSGTPWSLPGCGGGLSFHVTPLYCAQHGLSAGVTLYGQFYQRDSVAGPGRYALSSAVGFTLAP
ncbi:MAG: PD40 domain-containing protein [Planctomycetes bacterium]|nr:PD40 domain-containing protein [Planctomycetota bacterium]